MRPRDAKSGAAWEFDFNSSRPRKCSLDSPECAFGVALCTFTLPVVKGSNGATNRMAELSDGELRSLDSGSIGDTCNASLVDSLGSIEEVPLVGRHWVEKDV
jgi:hypothetical protein